MANGRKLLVVGSGGREHALAVRLLESPSVGEVIVLPGNAGTARAPARLEHKTLRNAAGDALAVAASERPDLVVVGPEAPLCDGVVDALGRAGFIAFGPSRAAARLEGSKAFMKQFAERHGILSASYRVLEDAGDVDRAVRSFDVPPVVKADGLCAGKGVVVAETHEQAAEAARVMLSGERFGAAGRRVVLEERIAGAEASVHAISDGERVIVLPAAQDHKRLGDGDTGPNTGGMGSYAPAPLVTPAFAERVRRDVLERAVRGMAADGAPYRGALFAGLMITPGGEPYLLEFNVRFGDPETQVLTSVTDGDFADALDGAARGRLAPDALRASERHALCVVLAAAGYPDAPRQGDAITGLERAERVEGARVFHAGTRLDAGRVVTAGGRVLGVTAVGTTLAEAHARAYRAAECIAFEGKQLRRDIGARALGGA
jgi:phosphoribosylamine---glycine ligase